MRLFHVGVSCGVFQMGGQCVARAPLFSILLFWTQGVLRLARGAGYRACVWFDVCREFLGGRVVV